MMIFLISKCSVSIIITINTFPRTANMGTNSSEVIRKISAEYGNRSWARRFSPTRGNYLKLEDEVNY